MNDKSERKEINNKNLWTGRKKEKIVFFNE